MSFTKRVEDFTCEHCGTLVHGNGFTNHCPKCLWSKHVDVDPGDRLASCGGMMEPIRILVQGDQFSVIQRCVKCGHERKNRISSDDDMKVVTEISSRPPPGYFSS